MNKPVFPHESPKEIFPGMSLLEYYAGQALAGYMAGDGKVDIAGNHLFERMAENLFIIAEAMIKETEKRNNSER